MARRSELPANPGTIGRKHCPVCHRQVLAAYRGEVTAVGRATILSVAANGDVKAACECGTPVTWAREVSRPT